MTAPVTIDLITSSPMGDLPAVMGEIREKFGDVIRVRVFPVALIDSGRMDEAAVSEQLRGSSVILYDIRGNGRTYQLLKRLYDSSGVPMCSIHGGSPEILGLTRLGGFSIQDLARRTGGQAQVDYTKMKQLDLMVDRLAEAVPGLPVRDMRNWTTAIRYWNNPHRDNLKNLLLFMAREYGGDGLAGVEVSPPFEKPEFGVYDPWHDTAYEDLGAYMAAAGYDPDKPTIGILFYGNVHYDVSVVGVRALAERLRPHANIIPAFTGGVKNLPALERFFTDKKYPVDAIVSIIWFRLNGGPMGGDPAKTMALLSSADVPLYTPVTLYSTDIRDWEDSPNGAGGVEVLATVVFPEIDGSAEPIPIFGLRQVPGYGEVRQAAPIADRVDRIAARALRRVALRRKPNRDKRVALVIYDYPPGEASIGGAAYLDTFRSVEAILERLAAEGYRVEPFGVKEALLSSGAANSPEFLRARGAIRLPVSRYLEWYGGLPAPVREDVERSWGPPPGKVMVDGKDILLPAVRSGNVLLGIQPSRGVHEEGKAYHDKHLPPHHQYLAFYLWLEREFGADALVHVGTHGTLEFLPGKEVALSSRCYPDLLAGDLPHFYFYHVTNPSEAVIAKRRSYGTLINYAPPAFTTAGLYGDLLALEDLLAEHGDAAASDGKRAAVLDKVRETCARLGLDFQSAEQLHEELTSMKASVIPKGLHVLGQPLEDQSLENLLCFVLGRDNPGAPSLVRALGGREDAARSLVRDHVMSGGDAALPEGLEPTLEYGRELRRRIAESDELGALARALDGRFILPNISGDPIRTPEVFPTGRNSYQFDPRLVPSEAAYGRGREIAENTLREFYREHGRYPETVGMVLWGFETAKTRGETVAQALAYLGLKVVQGKSWYPSIKVVPAEELGRPRIDVNINICGFFRDMFPNLILSLSQGIARVAALDEDVSLNYVRKHTAAIRAELEKSGAGNPARLSTARIFGPASGEYGTNLPSIIETSDWQEEAQLAGQYVENMCHAYGDGMMGVRSDGLFRQVLGSTELVTQVRDTNEYEVSDLDHYYEFLGGLAKSVQVTSGRRPVTLVSDTTNERIRTMDASKAVVRGTYTRLLNPEWIDGLLAHDFHGAQKVADRVGYLIGFAATVGVKSEVFQNVSERLVFDEEMLRRLRENNAFATREVTKRLLEAEKRGYWDARPEDVERLKAIYLQIEIELENMG